METLYTKAFDFSMEKLNEERFERIVNLLTETKTIGELNVSWNKIISTHATTFATALLVNKSLTHLNLSHNHIEKQIATDLFHHETVTHLNLSHIRIPDGFLEQITMAKNLQYLDISCILVHHQGLYSCQRVLVQPLSILLLTTNTLKYLNVSCNCIVSEDAKQLFNALLINTSLTDLNFAQNKIDGFCILELTEMLKQNRSLKKLNLSNTKLNSMHLKQIVLALSENHVLSELDLSSNLIQPCVHTMESVEILLKNETLTALNLSDNMLGEDALRTLAKELKSNTTLKKLYLDESMTLSVVKKLSVAIQQNKTLSSLYLGVPRHMFFEENSVKAKEITTSLIANNVITSLDFSYYSLGTEGAKQIAESLKSSKTITDLKLRWNNFLEKDLICIAESLIINKSLLNLTLTMSGYCTKAIKALWNALKTNRTLVSLDVSLDSLLDIEFGLNELLEVLKCNHALNSVILFGFRMNSNALQELAQAFQLNTTIIHFKLDHYLPNGHFPFKACPEEIMFYLERNQNLLRKLTGIARYIFSHKGETELILKHVSKKDLEEFEEYKGRSALIKSLNEFDFCSSQAVKIIDYVKFFTRSNFFNITGLYEVPVFHLPFEVLFNIASYLRLKDIH